MSHTGGGQTASPFRTLTIFFSSFKTRLLRRVVGDDVRAVICGGFGV
jgi:hypothetical protein